MKFGTGFSNAIITAALFLIPVSSFSQDEQLSLKHGVYVVDGVPCKGAPNAALMSWDGAGFSGAHSSKCKSRVVTQKGAQFQISTTCAAQRDGTANPPDSAYVDLFSLRRLAGDRFEISRQGQAKTVYRWCGERVLD